MAFGQLDIQFEKQEKPLDIIKAKTSFHCCSSRSTSSDSAIDTASPLELANRLSELESELM